jgi:hypothetical protein
MGDLYTRYSKCQFRYIILKCQYIKNVSINLLSLNAYGLPTCVQV